MIKKTLSLLLSLVLLLSFLPVFEHSIYASVAEPLVHVKLKNYLGNKTVISLTSSGTYKTGDGKVSINSNTEYMVKLEQSKLKLYQGSQLLSESTSFTLAPSDPNSYLTINNRSYKGSFEFIMETISGKTYIRPINTVGIEDYLKGVVPREMPALWNIEALKAQAVAARTYSWNYGGQTITDTINHQVYGGLTDSHPNSDNAVEATTGQVLKYGSKLIDAVFSASNGGVMESAKNVWGYEYAYLQNGADSFDNNYSWEFSLQKTQIDMKDKDLANPDAWWKTTSEKDTKIVSLIKSWLNNNSYKDKDIKIVSIPTLAFNNPSSTTRVTTGSITVQFYVKDLKDKDGNLILQEVKQANVAASKVRAIIGVDTLKSYLITKSASSTTAHSVAGKGYGHGVGLSQYGANGRANSGQKYSDILSFYYPSANLVTEYIQSEITTPVITDTKAIFANTNDTVSVFFSINKTANTTVRVKDSTGIVVATLLNNAALHAGNYNYTANVANWNNGSYTAEIIATDSNKQTATAHAVVQVAKLAAPSISSSTTKYDKDANKVVASFHVNQATKTTVIVKDSNHKAVKTLANNQSLTAGYHSFTWDVANVNNGAYTFEITSINSANKKQTVKQSFTLKKTVVQAPIINNVKTSYDTSGNKIKVSFHVNQASNTTVKIVNNKNKVVKTLTFNKSLKAGSSSYTWSVGSTSDGFYSATIESVNISKLKKSVSKKFTLYKVKTGTVKASKLNIRQKSSTSSKVVGSIPNDKKVTIYEKSGSWYKVKYGKVTGYVSTKYVKNVKERK